MSEQPGLLPISAAEMARLMRASTDHGALSCAFGTGGVAVKLAESAWAEPLVREWRGQTFNSGAGI